jgi:hypothetical protein
MIPRNEKKKTKQKKNIYFLPVPYSSDTLFILDIFLNIISKINKIDELLGY